MPRNRSESDPSDSFETPGGPSGDSDETAATSFSPPPAGTSAEQAAFVIDQQSMSGVSTQLLDARGAIEDALSRQDRSSVRTLDFGATAESDPMDDVEGVGIGFGDPGDGAPGQPTLQVFVTGQLDTASLREVLVSGMGVQAAGDLPITVQRSGRFESQAFDFRMRPAPGGISVGHVKVTAGTLGCLCVGRQAPRNSRLMILSNNHVLANSNSAVFGDHVLQPGRYDGGQDAADQVAILERFVPLQYGGAVNYVDCATAWAWPDRVRRELIYRSGTGLQLYRIGSNPLFPQLGWVVGKSGRTTELTQGRIVSTNWSGWVNYGAAGQAFFRGQFVTQGTSGNFSAPGDSGSVIWKWDTGLAPVGLLFAGGGGFTIGSPMPWVTALLDINLYT